MNTILLFYHRFSIHIHYACARACTHTHAHTVSIVMFFAQMLGVCSCSLAKIRLYMKSPSSRHHASHGLLVRQCSMVCTNFSVFVIFMTANSVAEYPYFRRNLRLTCQNLLGSARSLLDFYILLLVTTLIHDLCSLHESKFVDFHSLSVQTLANTFQ